MEKQSKKDSKAAEVKIESAQSFVFTHLFTEMALMSRFSIRYLREFFIPPYEVGELLRQSYLLGFRSLSLVCVTGFIMGLVLTIQSRPTMAEFGAESWIPKMVGVSIIREIGPVITALICAGKVGSGIGAELGSMRVTEQIDAMDVSGTNSFKYLVVSRVTATMLMVPVLVICSDAIALFGSYVGINITDRVTLTLFFAKVFESLDFIDVIPAFIKSFFFGWIIGIVGCFKGYYSNKGTEGVGQAANSAVVIASLMVFIIDMIAVQITSLFM